MRKKVNWRNSVIQIIFFYQTMGGILENILVICLGMGISLSIPGSPVIINSMMYNWRRSSEQFNVTPVSDQHFSFWFPKNWRSWRWKKKNNCVRPPEIPIKVVHIQVWSSPFGTAFWMTFANSKPAILVDDDLDWIIRLQQQKYWKRFVISLFAVAV